MSHFEEYGNYDALGLAGLVSRGETSPAELLAAAIDRLDRVNPQINAVVTTLYDRAQEEIEAGLPDGPFRGVPFLLKDLTAIYAGARLSYGSRHFADYFPDHDSEMVRRHKQGGLVIFGKTNTPEFGLNYSTEPLLFGPTRNPWHTDHIAGGSSGGAAAAVAAGIVPMAHATDGGGSIRVPAACCGLFGLKPTRGRNPAGPDRGEGWSGMSVEHVVSRSVRDSAALLDLTAGPDVGAPYWALPPERPFLEEVGADPGSLRIAFTTEAPSGAPVEADCVAAAEQAASLLATLGHRVEQAPLAVHPDQFTAAFQTIIAANTMATLRSYAAEHGRSVEPEKLERMTWLYAQRGDRLTATDYASAIQTIHRVGRQVAHFFQQYDIFLSPVTGQPPQLIGAFDTVSEDADQYMERLFRFVPFTAIFNVSGNPAMSVPLSWNAGGLPIGVQFAGRYGDEATLFRLAGQLEQARPWKERRPPIWA